MSTDVTPVSFRVDAEEKARIKKAADADGYKNVSRYARAVIFADLEDRDEDGCKQNADAADTDVNAKLTEDNKRLQDVNERLHEEITHLRELLKGKEAHIADLQMQVGFQTQIIQKALPPAQPPTEKLSWWQRRKRTKRKV